MLALSLVLVFSRKENHKIEWKGAGRAFATWGAFAVSVAVLKIVGFLISFAVLTFFIVAVMYRRPPAIAALVAIGVAAGFYLIFPLALGVALP
jgi:ABC-type transport system involved in multi-copper enzyme maturation permease subunit